LGGDALIAAPYLWAVGSTGQNLGSGVACLIVLGTPVVLAFGCFGLALGAERHVARLSVPCQFARHAHPPDRHGAWLLSARSALTIGLVVLILAASPTLLGQGLRKTAIGFAFDWVNPFSTVLNAIDAVVIDSEPLLAQSVPFVVALAWMLLALWYARRSVSRLTGLS
jgi:hypothetical protein